MRKVYPLFIFIFFLFDPLFVLAQEGILGAVDNAIGKNLGRKGQAKIEYLDSIDFQFAISVNEGAGYFDIVQKGERGSKLLYSFKPSSEKTFLELCRDSLEIGVGMYKIRRYKKAEERLRITQYQLEDYGLTDHIVYLRVLSNLGLVCMTQGRMAEAEDLINFSVEQSEQRMLGKQNAPYIANLNNLAKLKQLQGHYVEAEDKFEEAQRLAEGFFGNSMQLAIILNNKAMLYQALGQYDRAIEEMNLAIGLADNANKDAFEGSKSFDVRKFDANLATLLQISNQLEASEKLYLKLDQIFRNKGQTRNAEYAGLNNQMGLLYFEMGQPEKVRPHLVKALNIYKKKWGENNIYFAKAAHDLGDFLRITEEYGDAEKWLDKTYTIRKQLLAPSHPDYIDTQESLAILYWKTNRNKKAYELYKDVMEKTIDVVNKYFPPMSEAEKTKFWDITSPKFQRFYNFAIETYTDNPEVIRDIYNYNLATKGLLLNATTKVRNAILKSGDKQLKEDYLKWQDKKEQIGRYYSYSKGKRKAQNINLEEEERIANEMERALSEKSAAFSQAFSAKHYDYTELQEAMSSEEAIVDIIRVRGFDQEFNNDVNYIGLILSKDKDKPEMVVINDGVDLELKQARFYRNAIHYKVDDNSSYLRFWKPIEDKLVNFERVYFAPDGVYNQINVNTLRVDESEYVINKHDLLVIGNSNDIKDIKQSEGESAKKDAFLLGYPEYGSPEIPLLPGTQVEINDITNILTSDGYQTYKYTEEQATEAQVKLIENPRIVHIATHGFFNKDAEGSGSVFGVETAAATENPLLRSGLMLAGSGANPGDTISADIISDDNGILTAYEAMTLNLDETLLVVLSACETGLGEIKSGEGVYGLQRAFQVAGADALIMSLWKVSDEATQQLMTNFYQNWVKLGNKHEAFREAQLSLMETYKEPYFWGAFVMIGG